MLFFFCTSKGENDGLRLIWVPDATAAEDDQKGLVIREAYLMDTLHTNEKCKLRMFLYMLFGFMENLILRVVPI